MFRPQKIIGIIVAIQITDHKIVNGWHIPLGHQFGLTIHKLGRSTIGLKAIPRGIFGRKATDYAVDSVLPNILVNIPRRPLGDGHPLRQVLAHGVGPKVQQRQIIPGIKRQGCYSYGRQTHHAGSQDGRAQGPNARSLITQDRYHPKQDHVLGKTLPRG